MAGVSCRVFESRSNGCRIVLSVGGGLIGGMRQGGLTSVSL
jgi:hypothetical protein